jgi:hypothetical protein
VLRGKNKSRDQANQKNLADHRLVRTGNARRNTLSGIGIGCLHLQLAERLPSARRGGKLPAQVKSVNSGCADNQQRSLFVAVIPNPSRLPRVRFFHTPFLSFAPTRVLHFLSQGKFFVVIEN